MTKRNVKKNWFDKYKKVIYIGTGALTIMTISFVVTLNIFSAGKYEEEKDSQSKISLANVNDKVNSDITIYKIRSTDESSVNTINDNLVEKNNTDVKSKTKNDNKKTINAKKIEEEKNIPVTAKIADDITFILPLDGEIINEFAPEKLIFSNTLEEWITHNGVDIKGEEAMPVKVIADGVISDVKLDPRYGNTIIVEHRNGYKSIYSNLSTTELVKVKQEVKKGDIISGVGNGYGFELKDGPHIHIEVLKDGNYISIFDLIK